MRFDIYVPRRVVVLVVRCSSPPPSHTHVPLCVLHQISAPFMTRLCVALDCFPLSAQTDYFLLVQFRSLHSPPPRLLLVAPVGHMPCLQAYPRGHLQAPLRLTNSRFSSGPATVSAQGWRRVKGTSILAEETDRHCCPWFVRSRVVCIRFLATLTRFLVFLIYEGCVGEVTNEGASAAASAVW